MKKVILFFSSILISGMLISSFPSITYACSCAEPPSVEDEFMKSKAVFSGKVIELKEKSSLMRSHKSVLFEVNHTWKGTDKSQIVIATGLGGGDCGIEFAVGKEYLVYADNLNMFGSNSLETGLCDRTNELIYAPEDIEILGQGQSPTEEVDLRGEFARNDALIWFIIIAAIGITAGIVVIKKNKTKAS